MSPIPYGLPFPEATFQSSLPSRLKRHDSVARSFYPAPWAAPRNRNDSDKHQRFERKTASSRSNRPSLAAGYAYLTKFPAAGSALKNQWRF